MSSDTPETSIRALYEQGRTIKDYYDNKIARLERELTAVTAERDDLRENGQRLMEAADGWKAEAQRLQERVNELNHNQRIQDSATAAVMDRAERAEAECAAARKDAERYRWLRDTANYGDIEYTMQSRMQPHERNAAIDAAIAQGGKE